MKKAVATRKIEEAAMQKNVAVSNPRNAEEASQRKVPVQMMREDPTPKMPVKAYMKKSAKPTKTGIAQAPQKKTVHLAMKSKSLPKN